MIINKLLNFLTNTFYKIRFPKTKIQYRAIIDKESKIGKNVYIGKNSEISNSIIDDDIMIHDNNIISDCKLKSNVKISNSNTLWRTELGSFSYISPRSEIQLTSIGKFCSIGPRFQCSVGNHPMNYLSTSPVFFSTLKQCGTTFADKDYFEERSHTIIGNDVWIGASVTMQSGIKVGDGAIIGNGALVKRNVPAYSIVIGVPAKVVMYRFSEEIIKELKEIKWWNMSDNKLREAQKYFVTKDIWYFINWVKKTNAENIN